jgi:dolichol-phosphate mannosyltransferase
LALVLPEGQRGNELDKTLVIIPTFNEAQQIAATIRAVLDQEASVSILVVDDNSPDGTSGIVETFAEADSRVSLLRRDSRLGLGRAYLAGFEWGFGQGFDFIVEMDADGSHQARDLSSLLKAASSADLVIGSRWVAGGQVRNWPTIRKMISRVGNSYAKFMLGTKIQDMTSGFRVFRAHFLQELVAEPVSSHGYSFQVELAFRASQKGRVIERPITFVERINGKSKMTLAIVFEALTKVTLWGLRRFFS